MERDFINEIYYILFYCDIRKAFDYSVDKIELM